MKKKVVLSILTLTLCFFILNCKNEADDEPELTRWNGTWNSFGNFIGESWLNETFTQGASEISSSTGQTVSVDLLKGIAAQVFATPFKSFVVQGDIITFYPEPDAGGTGIAITYTYKQKEYDAEEEDYWYYFEGNQAGDQKYLIALPPTQDSPQTPVHFHSHYANDSFQTAVAKKAGMSQPVGIRKGTTNSQIIAQIQVLLEEVDWAAILASLPH
jgi:Zn/Cd-binding protein ZinT